MVAHLEGEATRGVSWRGQHQQLKGAERQRIAAGHVAVGGLQLRGGVSQMHDGRSLGRGLHRLLCAGVASMRMGEHDPPDGQPAQLREDFRRIVAGVDNHGLLRVGAGHHVAIGVLFADVDFLDGQPGHIDRLATLLAMAEARQVVKYTFVKIDPAALAWPAGGRHLFVYPMWKKRVWYRLPYERRKAMMVEHFAIGHRYPQVKINTAYSFGLDDQEFVVAFECDEPAAFLDLVMELRESQASRYTERETPIFTCVLMPPADALQLALGLSAPESAETDDLQRQVSLISGG